MDFPSEDFLTNLGFSCIFFGLLMGLVRLFAGYKDLTMPAIIGVIVGIGIVYVRNKDAYTE